MTTQSIVQGTRNTTLADVLERVLDKGLVVAGDIRIKLVDIELLTIQVRLVVCSMDKAAAMGMDFWRTDPHLSSLARRESASLQEGAREPVELAQRVAELEALVAKLDGKGPPSVE